MLEKLQLSTFSVQAQIVEITTSKAILDRIQHQAEKQWGDKWMANLVKEYVKIAREQGDEKATPVSRRTQIERAFERGSCNLDTAIMLAAALGCRFQMVCTSTTVIDL